MRAIYIKAGLGFLALATVVGFWFIAATGWAVTLLQDEVRSCLDRDLKVAGGAHLEFLPELVMRLDNVRLSGAPGMEDDFLKAASFRVPITFAGIFSHQLDLTRITLRDAEIALVIDEMGRTSWPEVQSSAPTPVTLFLDHAAIRFFDQRSGQAFAFRDARMAVELSALGEMTLEGAATINAQHANFQAYVKDVARISARGSPAGFSLEAPALLASFNGRLGTGQGLGLAGTVNLSGPDLRQALRWAGGAPGGTMGLKDFSLSGGLDAKARAFGVHQALLNVDGISGSGDLTLDFRGEVPKFQAVIATDTIDLDTYIKPGTAKLGFSALRGIDGAARITAKGLNYSGLKFGPAKIAATLDHGRLDAQIFFNSASQAQITLDGASSVDGFTLAFNSNNADAGRLLEPFTGIGWLEGKGTIHATLSGNGKTREEMISTLKGEARIALTDGALKGLDVGQTLSATAREIQNGWPARAEAKTPFTSLEVSFTIADGIAAIKTLKLASPALAVSGSGETDFLRRALDLRVDPRLVTAKTGETAGLPVAIVVQGPWGSPRIYPDMPGILANPKAAYEALTARGLPQLPAN